MSKRPPVDESVEARFREINDALELLRGLVAKRFDELTVYESFRSGILSFSWLKRRQASACVYS